MGQPFPASHPNHSSRLPPSLVLRIEHLLNSTLANCAAAADPPSEASYSAWIARIRRARLHLASIHPLPFASPRPPSPSVPPPPPPPSSPPAFLSRPEDWSIENFFKGLGSPLAESHVSRLFFEYFVRSVFFDLARSIAPQNTTSYLPDPSPPQVGYEPPIPPPPSLLTRLPPLFIPTTTSSSSTPPVPNPPSQPAPQPYLAPQPLADSYSRSNRSPFHHDLSEELAVLPRLWARDSPLWLWDTEDDQNESHPVVRLPVADRQARGGVVEEELDEDEDLPLIQENVPTPLDIRALSPAPRSPDDLDSMIETSFQGYINSHQPSLSVLPLPPPPPPVTVSHSQQSPSAPTNTSPVDHPSRAASNVTLPGVRSMFSLADGGSSLATPSHASPSTLPSASSSTWPDLVSDLRSHYISGASARQGSSEVAEPDRASRMEATSSESRNHQQHVPLVELRRLQDQVIQISRAGASSLSTSLPSTTIRSFDLMAGMESNSFRQAVESLQAQARRELASFISGPLSPVSRAGANNDAAPGQSRQPPRSPSHTGPPGAMPSRNSRQEQPPDRGQNEALQDFFHHSSQARSSHRNRWAGAEEEPDEDSALIHVHPSSGTRLRVAEQARLYDRLFPPPTLPMHSRQPRSGGEPDPGIEVTPNPEGSFAPQDLPSHHALSSRPIEWPGIGRTRVRTRADLLGPASKHDSCLPVEATVPVSGCLADKRTTADLAEEAARASNEQRALPAFYNIDQDRPFTIMEVVIPVDVDPMQRRKVIVEASQNGSIRWNNAQQKVMFEASSDGLVGEEIGEIVFSCVCLPQRRLNQPPSSPPSLVPAREQNSVEVGTGGGSWRQLEQLVDTAHSRRARRGRYHRHASMLAHRPALARHSDNQWIAELVERRTPSGSDRRFQLSRRPLDRIQYRPAPSPASASFLSPPGSS